MNAYQGVERGIGRPRWLHATPLLSAKGTVGVWMVILVDDGSERIKSLKSNSTLYQTNKGFAPAIKSVRACQPWDEPVGFDS